MAVSKNKDRRHFDEACDLTPVKVQGIFQSANTGYVRRQSRLASDIQERDPAIAQAWSVRVASIAACPWEVVGGSEDQRRFLESSLRNIQPSYDTNLSTFAELLQNLQSAVMHGFSLAQTNWAAGMSRIDGFQLYSQALFSFQDSDLPYFVGKGIDSVSSTLTNEARRTPKYPEWVYHTATNSRDTEPLRSGLVRPLAWLYTFRRHVLIEYLRGIEKYGLPLIQAQVDQFLWENSTEKQALDDALANMTYDGYMITPKDKIELTFPTAQSAFDVMVFDNYLQYSEKQIFRLILGQDSTSSADNSNRSTAQVHNLVRADMLASDAKAVEETVNNQIIKPLFEGEFGLSDSKPHFRFKLKGVDELQAMATVIKTLSEAGLETDLAVLTEKFGFTVTKKDIQPDEVQNVD
jgi:phage gp29-like protein